MYTSEISQKYNLEREIFLKYTEKSSIFLKIRIFPPLVYFPSVMSSLQQPIYEFFFRYISPDLLRPEDIPWRLVDVPRGDTNTNNNSQVEFRDSRKGIMISPQRLTTYAIYLRMSYLIYSGSKPTDM